MMNEAQNLVKNKEGYDDRFERKIQTELDKNLGLEELQHNVKDIEPIPLNNPEEYPDWMVEENEEKFEEFKSEWSDIKYTINWLFDNGYLPSSRYPTLQREIDSIDDALLHDDYFDTIGNLEHKLEYLINAVDEDLKIVRDKEKRMENMQMLKQKKEQLKRDREMEIERKNELKRMEQEKKREGGSRKDVDVKSYIRETFSGKPTKVKKHKRKKPER